MSEPFLGEIRLFAGTFAPVGWNFCNGELLAISENDALFALIGTTYGGDGQATFALPDLRGRVPVHQGTGQGLSPYTIGQTGGAEAVTLTVAQIPTHSHTLQVTTNQGTTADPKGNVIAAAPGTCSVFAARPANTLYNSAHVSPSTSGNLPHENRQPFVAINYIIALQGIWPPQN